MIYELLYRTINMLKWGAGTGADLTAEQIDSNISTIEEWIKDLVENVPAADSIANIVASDGGKSLTIFLQSGTTFGPFPLPMASFRFLDTGFIAGQGVFAWDLFVYQRAGFYLVLQDHVMADTFDPNAADTDGNLYRFLFNPFAGSAVQTIPESTDFIYTLQLTDANLYLRWDNLEDLTVIVPADLFPADTEVHFRQSGAGRILVVGDTGVFIHPPRPGFATSTPWDGANGGIKCVDVDANEWDYFGPGTEGTA